MMNGGIVYPKMKKIKLFQEQKEAEDYFYNQKQSNRDLK